MGRKHPYTLFVINSSFRKYECFVQSNKKSPLSFVQKPLHRAKMAQNAERKTCSRNGGENALHTISILQLFRYFVNFSLLFAISVQGAYGIGRKTCSRNMANAFYRLFTVRRFFVGSPLFRCCLQIVYSGLGQATQGIPDSSLCNFEKTNKIFLQSTFFGLAPSLRVVQKWKDRPWFSCLPFHPVMDGEFRALLIVNADEFTLNQGWNYTPHPY